MTDERSGVPLNQKTIGLRSVLLLAAVDSPAGCRLPIGACCVNDQQNTSEKEIEQSTSPLPKQARQIDEIYYY